MQARSLGVLGRRDGCFHGGGRNGHCLGFLFASPSISRSFRDTLGDHYSDQFTCRKTSLPPFLSFFRVEVGRMEAKTEPEKGTGVWHAVQPFIDPRKWGVARKNNE